MLGKQLDELGFCVIKDCFNKDKADEIINLIESGFQTKIMFIKTYPGVEDFVCPMD